MTTANVERWWMFGGSNLQAQYGYGTEAEANYYAEKLNRGKVINLYRVTKVDDPEKIAVLNDGDEGFAISDCINQ